MSDPIADVQGWHVLRTVAARNPTRVDAHLCRLLTDPAGDAARQVDRRILLAEIRLQQGDLAGAFDADSARSAAALAPRDWPRLALALSVEADIAVCVGHQEAVPACDSAVVAAERCQPADPWRVWHACALQAVAVYHRCDPAVGLRHLTVLAGCLPEPAAMVTAAVTAGLYVMRTQHTGRQSGRPPPLPGGALQPDLTRPVADFLAYRIRLQPAASAGQEQPQSPAGPVGPITG